MKKFIFAFALSLFLVGCGTKYEGSVSVTPEERVLQYLETNLLSASDSVCASQPLAKPAANVVEVWALCKSPSTGEAVSVPVKITFLGETTTHVVPGDGSEYKPSVEKHFSKIAVGHILNQQKSIDMTLLEKGINERLAEKNKGTME